MLTQDERDIIQRQLLQEREDALAALRDFEDERSETLLEETGEPSVFRFHMADIGTEAMEREKHFLLASNEGERLYRIDEALRRLYSDPEHFGFCRVCGRQIPMERLRILPEADLCAEHQRDREA